VQKLFSTNRGTTVLPVRWNGSPKNGQEDLFTSASTGANDVILKLVNYRPAAREVRINLAGARGVRRTGRAWVLSSPDLKAENSLEQPQNIAPVQQEFRVPGPEFSYTLAPNSLTVLRIGLNR
jgi:alpha-N-arabinofuranosidase